MTKREVAKRLRSLLTEAIRSLPDDVEYREPGKLEDFTTQAERDLQAPCFRGTQGALHLVELIVEEEPA